MSSALFLFLLAVELVTIHQLVAPIIGPKCWPDCPKQQPDQEFASSIIAKCQREGNCKGQRKEVIKERADLKNRLVKLGRKNTDVENAFGKTFLAKKAYYKSIGLESVDPADNGLWSHDIMLNAVQAQYLIDLYSHAGDNPISPEPNVGEKPKSGGGNVARGKRGNAVKWNEFPLLKWDLPIVVVIDPGYINGVADQIRQGLSIISSKTCIKFNIVGTAPNDGYYMHILPNMGGCGSAEIGRQSASLPGSSAKPSYIFINPQRCRNLPIPGVTVHEVNHALGIHHEHQRYDRNTYLTVVGAESDPAFIENMAVAWPGYTSWGTKYDFLSVMHYPVGPSPIPGAYMELTAEGGGEIYRNKIGAFSTLLSDGDVKTITGAYCSPPGCEDKHADCGWWETLSDFCQRTDASVKTWCPQTCQLCA